MADEVMNGAEPQYTAGESAGVLFLHDLGDTPQSMRLLARAFASAGFATDVPLLPGHGTELSDLETTTWDDWAGASQLAADELASRSGPIVAVGVGMGATLACWVAAEHESVAGVIAINPRSMPVPPEAIETMRAMIESGATQVPPLAPDISDKTARVLSYKTVPVQTLISMFGALEEMGEHWSSLHCPMLIAHSPRDHRVLPANAEWLATKIGGPVEELVLENSFHLAPLDVDHEALEKAAVEFARRITDA